MDSGLRLGLIKLSMLDSGRMTNQMVKESLPTLLVIFTKATGSIPKPMVKGNLSKRTAIPMLEAGRTMNHQEAGWRWQGKVILTKETSNKGSNMEKELINGSTDLHILEIGL